MTEETTIHTEPTPVPPAEKKASSMIERLDAWIHSHPTIDGAVAGGAVGTALGPLGTIAGVVIGADIGHKAGQDK